jgi:hypothetical protein
MQRKTPGEPPVLEGWSTFLSERDRLLPVEANAMSTFNKARNDKARTTTSGDALICTIASRIQGHACPSNS